MLKRDDPFTPQAKRGKRIRDYASPVLKTPLRNVMSADNLGHDVPEEDVKANVQKRNKALLLRSKKPVLMSPAPGISPKAAPLTYRSPIAQKLLSHSPSLSTLSNQKLTLEQMNRSFEEWMRIAADNKINAKNTWNFALIDYFSELSWLQDGDSINFQKASCTLDGCVKIYSSRVDSVVDETGKLLTGLNDRNDLNASSDEENEDSSQQAKQKKKRHVKQGDTLEKNPDNLSLKGKIESEGYTDPLFKKTCAEFDESASGTLLFNLLVDSQARVVFDSNCPLASSRVDAKIDDKLVDCSLLKDLIVDFEAFTLTPTMDSYSFLNESTVPHDRLAGVLEKLSAQQSDPMQIEENPFGAPVPSVNFPDFNDYDDNAGDPGDYYEDVNGNDHQASRVIEEDGYSSKAIFNTFAFLDEPGRMKTTWAGVEHWKIKRIKQSGSVNTHQAERQPKKLAEIDFTLTDLDLEHLLLKSSSSLTLTQINERGLETTLPDDLHFSSSDLTCLFTKPSWHFSKVKKSLTENGVREQVEFVPASPVHVNADSYQMMDGDGNVDIDDDVSYEHQNNDYTGTSTQTRIDLSQNLLTASADRSDSLQLNYSKRAKRVDVRLLKDSLWSTISSSNSTTISKIIAALPQQYSKKPKEELLDLSVPYAFICLLHLANEHGLSLKEVSGEILPYAVRDQSDFGLN